MKKLHLLPDSNSYNVKFGDGNIATRLNGGASRVRKDTVDNVHSINVAFSLNKEQYQYMMAFYRHITKRGALPFLMDLITDEGSPQTHKVQIVPNTFQLTEQSGRKYGVTFTVEAEPLNEHAERDTQLIANYESGKPLHTDPQQGWGNFFKPTELDENASNVQDGIYRINGDVVVSLRDAKGRIYQTRYTKQGIDVRFFDTKWSTWLNIGGKRLFRTFTTAYKHNTGEVVKQFDGAGINGNLPNGDYDVVVTEEYADGSQQEVARTRQVINITSGTLTTIPSNYAIFLQWSVPAKSGGYTEIWVSNTPDLSNAKLINVVGWPLDSYMYTGASQHENYYFWVRPIDKRGIEGAFTGPVKGEVATPFEEDFRNLQNQLQESLNQADAKADKKLQQLEAEVKDIVRKTTNTLNSDILTRLDSFDNRFRTEAQQRTEALQREADARTRAIQTEQSARVQAIKQSSDKAAADLLAKSNQLGTRITTVETVNNNQTQQINTLTTNLGNANAAIERESKTRADAISAEARTRETLVAKINNNTAAINEEKKVRAEKDRSQAEQTTQLSSRVAGAEADITSLRRTYSDFQSSQATQLTELKAEFSNINVGGRNLIRKSNPNTNDSQYLHAFTITEAPKFGEDVIVTLWGDLGAGRDTFGIFNSRGFGELAQLKKISDGVYQAKFKWADNTYTGGDKLSNTTLNVYAYPNTSTSTFNIKKVKFEKGTVPTDWTPAPEDTDEIVVNTQAQITQYGNALAQKDQALTEQLREANSRIGQNSSKITNLETTKATKTEVSSLARQSLQSLWEATADNAKTQAVKAAEAYATSKANDARIAAEQAAQAKADAAKAQAIASASGDATSKANAAKAQAIADAAAKDAIVKQQAAADAQAKADKALQDAKAHANNLQKSTDAKITRLEHTLSDAKGSFATKTEQLEAKVNNVKIGGRNLVKDSNPNATDANYLHLFKITEAPKFGDDVVVTLWGELGQGRTDFAVYNSEGWGELAKLKKVSDGIYQAQFKWEDNTYTGRNKTTNVNLNVYAYPQSATSNNTIKKVKFERGTIGTDWTPAPEDVGIEVDKTKATINEFKQVQATKDEASARKQTELTSKVNGLTTKVETNTSTINGVSAEKTVFIDNNGYLTGYKLLSDRNSGQPRGEIYFSVDKFKVGKPGYNNITPFTIDTANRIIAIDGSLVVNGEALIRKLNAGVIDAAKIKAESIDSSHIAANAITADKIGAGQITAQKIASRAITADHIASNSISTDKLITGSVTAAKIATASITADKMHIENLSALSSDLGNIRGGDINIGGGAFTVNRNGDLYARNGRFEGTVYADKIEGDVLKFYPFSKANTGRYRLVYTNTSQKDVLLSLQNLSFLTPNSKSSYWVRIKINGQQVYRQEFWSIFSHSTGGRYGGDVYRGIFYNIPFIYIANGNTTSEIIIEVDHQTDYNTSAVDIISIPYILAARI
jgi:hypothetical protein